MRIKIIGDCESASVLRGYLSKAGIAVVEGRPGYTIMLEERAVPGHVVFDSIDCELEKVIFKHVRMLTATPVSVHTSGGIQSDVELRIVLPNRDEDRHAVEVGVYRGLLELTGMKWKRPWWKRILPLAALLLVIQLPAWSQFQIYGIMRPSGPQHLPGYVPDPGAVAGTTKFLREDAAWQVPPFAPLNHNLLSATHGDTTPFSPPVRGDIITAQGVAPLWTRLGKGTQYQVLVGGATDPGWGAVALDQATAVAGLLGVGSGGTGVNTFTANGVLYGNAATPVLVTAGGGANTVLWANGGAPSFSASPTIGTSVTTPIIYGGTAIGSTLTLAGTSNGAPVNAHIILNGTRQGNVGIGTATPSAQLVVGDDLALGAGNKIVIGNLTGNAYLEIGQSNADTFIAEWKYNVVPANSYGLLATRGYAHDFHIDGAALLLQNDSGGNVGVGVSPPLYKLHVSGSLSATSYYVGASAGVDKVCAAAPTAMTVNKGIITAITCI